MADCNPSFKVAIANGLCIVHSNISGVDLEEGELNLVVYLSRGCIEASYGVVNL